MNATLGSRGTAGALLALAMACADLPPVAAADFPYRIYLDESSRAHGLGAATLPLLRREPGRGARTVADEMLLRYRVPRGAITTAGASTRSVKPGRVRYTAPPGGF